MTNNGIYSTAPRGFEPATARKERGMVFSLQSRLFSSVKHFVSHCETFCFIHESVMKLIPSLGDSLPTASSSSCSPSAMAKVKVAERTVALGNELQSICLVLADL